MRAVEQLQAELAETGYLATPTLATAVHLGRRLQRPLLLEGEAGVGKSEFAKALAASLKTRLMRLPCYEGLDATAALYEWNYQRQLLAIRVRERSVVEAAALEEHIFSDAYLLRRPLLEAISQPQSPVLLIDEVDRADQEFEAYLLEILSDYQVSVPELGTIKAVTIPHVNLTSNGTRELSDALRRRCLHALVPFPEPAIIERRLPATGPALAGEIARFAAALRSEDLEKKPGIAEAPDFAAALMGFGVDALPRTPEAVQASLVALLKTDRDQAAITPEVTARLMDRAA